MNVIERIGVDIGPAGAAVERAPAAARAGARWVRMRLGLDGHATVDERLLQELRESLGAARKARQRVLAVVDSDLTVAPQVADGLGVAPAVASAWERELAANAARLVAELGADVAAWEILPGPNWRGSSGAAPRLEPARWAHLLTHVAKAMRQAAPEATLVAGALISDGHDDGVDYLREAARAAGWRRSPPFDAVAVQLAVLPEGGPSEADVSATVRERVRRLWRAAVAAVDDEDVLDGVWISGLSWDAVYAGEAAQARNLWAAYDALTADPLVRAVVWTGLVDRQQTSSGLFAGRSLDAGDRRPAWRAFQDFATYAAQISPAPPILQPEDDDLSDLPLSGAVWDPSETAPPPRPAAPPPVEEQRAPSAETVPDGVSDEVSDEVPAAPPHEGIVTPPSAGSQAPAQEGGTSLPSGPTTEDAGLHADPPAPTVPTIPEGAGGQGGPLHFRMPTIEEVLRATGLEGARLAAALAEIDERYGSREWLPPGDYTIELPASSEADRATDSPSGRGTEGEASLAEDGRTNQEMLSALYRAGGGSWRLLKQAGLELSTLVTQRDAEYAGPSPEHLPGLSDQERDAVRRALGGG